MSEIDTEKLKNETLIIQKDGVELHAIHDESLENLRLFLYGYHLWDKEEKKLGYKKIEGVPANISRIELFKRISNFFDRITTNIPREYLTMCRKSMGNRKQYDKELKIALNRITKVFNKTDFQ